MMFRAISMPSKGISRGRGPAMAAALMLSLGIAGCGEVGPDYQPPQTDLAPFHNLDAVAARKVPTPAPQLDQWWTGFNDPILVTVVHRALDQNLDLATALARVQQARAAAAAAGAQLLPTVDLNAGASVERQSLQSPLGVVEKTFPGFNRYEREYTVGPAASWEIDLFGGLRRGADAAGDESAAAEADQAGTRISVVADAADAYMQIRGFQARIAVAQDQIKTDAHLLDMVGTRYRLGQADAREIAQAEALFKQARASLPPLRIGLETELNRLDVLMGAQPGTYAAELATPGDIPTIPAIGGDDKPVDVLRRRPDIIAAERRLAASNEQIGVAIADYYPKISLSGILGFDSVSVNHLLSNKAFQPIGTGAVSWRLFDFGKVDAEVASARGANAETLARYRQAVLKAVEDVEDALISLSETEVHVVELQGEVDSLARSRDLSEKAYRAGSITLTDVLDADRQLLAARDELDSNRADAARAAVSTFRALGGGWDVPPASTAVAQR